MNINDWSRNYRGTGNETCQSTGSCVSAGTTDAARIQAIAHDYTSLPSYSNCALQYWGKTTAGNLAYLAGVPAANAAGIESINVANTVITTNSSPLIFGTYSTERMRIDGSGNVTIHGAATLASTVSLTGGQIAFPATQIPSANVNTLDDYEKGTFTPSLTFGAASVV
jgi:hypothetical protein